MRTIKEPCRHMENIKRIKETHWEHANSAQKGSCTGIEPATFLMWGGSAKLTSEPTCCPTNNIIRFFVRVCLISLLEWRPAVWQLHQLPPTVNGRCLQCRRCAAVWPQELMGMIACVCFPLSSLSLTHAPRVSTPGRLLRSGDVRLSACSPLPPFSSHADSRRLAGGGLVRSPQPHCMSQPACLASEDCVFVCWLLSGIGLWSSFLSADKPFSSGSHQATEARLPFFFWKKKRKPRTSCGCVCFYMV